MESILLLKTINELQEYRFYIPSYQRGYRWGKNEVEDLLNDISEFMPRQISDTDEKTWYCLQPIIVKQKSDGWFEVIDGQQRLTTIYLILHYLNQDFKREKQERLFEIQYETRENSSFFLKNMGEDSDENASKYIDYHYINQAYETIGKWFEEKESGYTFDKGGFRSKLKFSSKIIWYQSFEEDSIAIFTRINIGKIPLTNAELIKALFLNSSNFEGGDSKRLKQKQFEIATEWDNIEHSLQNDKLWYFITGNKTTTNRIEFIFDLMNGEKDGDDKYSTFRFFNKRFQNKTQKIIEDNWSEVKQHFQRFNEWYAERDLYHKIGYLLCTSEININNLYKESSKLTKSEFKVYLDALIKDHLKNENLSDLQYGDKNIGKILLLYNILTMLNCEKDNSYFPFDIYKNEKWDIEHITSVKDTIPEKNREEWLQDALPFIDDLKIDGLSIKNKAQKCDCNDDESFKSLFEDIVAHFNSELDEDDINDMSNLTLLDSETNRGYKNAVFPLKRKTIIDRDKAGIFIPICTKNVFLKYFSSYPPKISFWTQDDRRNYEKDLETVLKEYLRNE